MQNYSFLDKSLHNFILKNTLVKKTLFEFAKLYGSIFQISDDLIDIESTLEMAGKSVNKDNKGGKSTLIEYMGIEESKSKITINLQEIKLLLKR